MKNKIKISKATVKLRNKICKKKNITILKIFDTNEHEFYKDVIFGFWQDKKVVLRVGEHRPLNFFRDGYCGKNIVIPKSYLINTKINYEIEEYLPGELFCDLMPKPKFNKLIVNDNWLRILIKAHWEFQSIARNIKLPIKLNKNDRILKYYKYAKKLIKSKQKLTAKRIITDEKFNYFWNKSYPCKWKYSIDNLIAMPNKKIGFIDLAGVSRRHWGYDLGWLFWPQWYYFSSFDYKKAKGHFDYLQKYFDLIHNFAPQTEKNNKNIFYQKCYLILFERIIGGLYDISASISHTKKMSNTQKKMFVDFLNKLLDLCIYEIQTNKH